MLRPIQDWPSINGNRMPYSLYRATLLMPNFLYNSAPLFFFVCCILHLGIVGSNILATFCFKACNKLFSIPSSWIYCRILKRDPCMARPFLLILLFSIACCPASLPSQNMKVPSWRFPSPKLSFYLPTALRFIWIISMF